MTPLSKEERIAAIKANPVFEHLRHSRLGLVLGGGGAKGAYQAGAIQCLRDLDLLRFDAISGTSVGALNGAAIGLGKLDEITRTWTTISFKKVLGFSPTALKAIVGHAVGAYLILNNRIVGLWLRLVISIIGFSLFNALLGIGPGLIVLGFALSTIAIGQRTGRFVSVLGRRISTIASAQFSLSNRSRLETLVSDVLWPKSAERPTLACSVSVTIGRETSWFDPDVPTFEIEAPPPGDSDIHYAIDRPRYSRGWVPKYKNLNQLSRQEFIDAVVGSASLPIVFKYGQTDYGFVTDGGLADNLPVRRLEGRCDHAIVISLDRSLATYEAIKRHVMNVARSETLAAAAEKVRPNENRYYRKYRLWLAELLISFEKNPGLNNRDYRRKRGKATIEEFDFAGAIIDLMVALKLARHTRIDWDYYNNNGAQKWRLFHTWDLPQTGEPTLVPLQERRRIPRIIELAPSQEIGGLLTGTLNFRATKAKRLIELGWQDMLARLERHVSEQTDVHA